MFKRFIGFFAVVGIIVTLGALAIIGFWVAVAVLALGVALGLGWRFFDLVTGRERRRLDWLIENIRRHGDDGVAMEELVREYHEADLGGFFAFRRGMSKLRAEGRTREEVLPPKWNPRPNGPPPRTPREAFPTSMVYYVADGELIIEVEAMPTDSRRP